MSTDIESRVLAAIWERTNQDAPRSAPVPTSAVTDDLTTGSHLSQQVRILSALESLQQEGFLERVGSDGSAGDLRLTEAGVERARAAADRIADRQITLVEDGSRQAVRIRTAAERLDRSVVEIARQCTDDGVFHVGDDFDESIVDREEQRDRVRTIVEEATATGAGEAVALVGSGGIGKTTLAETVLDSFQDSVVLDARCGGGAGAYGPIRSMLTDLAVEDPFEAAVEDTTDPEAQQSALFHEVTELLAPTDHDRRVLFFDELGNADRGTIEYLAYLFDRIDDYPLVVLCCYRPGVFEAASPIHRTFEADEGVGQQLSLSGLDQRFVGDLVESVVGTRGAPESLVAAIHERTDGNPLYVESTVETLLENDELDPEYRWYPESASDVELPEEAHELVRNRLDVLPSAAVDVLEWISLTDEALPVTVLESIVSVPPERLQEVLETLRISNVLVSTRSDAAVEFHSKVTRRSVLGRIDPAERRRRHRRLAFALEKDCADADPEDAGGIATTIASQYERGGLTEAAIEWYRESGSRAAAAHAHELAIDRYERALSLARDAERWSTVLDVLEPIGSHYHVLGQYDEALRSYRYICERADDEDRRRSAFHQRANIENSRGNYDRALKLVEEGRSIAPDAVDHIECQFRNVEAWAKMQTGDLDAAIETFQRQRSLAERIDDRPAIASAVSDLAVARVKRGEIDRARPLMEEAAERRREMGDDRQLAEVLNNLGLLQWKAGDVDAASETLERCYDLQTELGDRRGQSATLTNLGVIAGERGEYDAARRWYRESLELNRAMDDRQGIAILHGNLAEAAYELGDLDEAKRYAEQLIDKSRAIDDQAGVIEGRLHHAEVACERGQFDEALDRAESALETATSIDDREKMASSRATIARIHRHRGAYDDAIEAAETGRSIASEHGLGQQAGANACELVLTHVERGTPEAVDGIVDQLSDDPSVRELLATGRHAVATGNVDLARDRLASGLVRAEQSDRSLLAAKLHLALGHLEDDGYADHARTARTIAADRGATPIVERASQLVDCDGSSGCC